MTRRVLALALALSAALLIVGCGSSAQLDAIQVTPASAQIPSIPGTAQFEATGFYANGKNGNQFSQNLTTQVVWSSSVVSVATIDSNGLATAVGDGTTTITATGGNGGITGTATLTVGLGFGPVNDLLSITIVHPSQTLHAEGETAQYIAIGNFRNNPTTRDLTNQVTWSSSDTRVATINSAGLATAAGNCASEGSATITATAPRNTGSAVTGTAALNVGSCGASAPNLTVYTLGQGKGKVTSSPAGINCRSSVNCSADLALNTQVSLTAIADPGSYFVGWSANCKPEQNSTCSLTMVNNQTVGAIFNVQR